jgi:hypothetical protein
MHTHVYIRNAVLQLERGSYDFIKSGLRRKISSQSNIDILQEIFYRYSVNTVESHVEREVVRAHVVGPFNHTRHALRWVGVDHDHRSVVVLGQDFQVIDG